MRPQSRLRPSQLLNTAPGGQPEDGLVTSGSDPSGEPKTAPLHVAPPSAQPAAGGVAPDHSVAPSAIGATASDACPTCGAQMAIDQRYCLNCGHRRGEPRLPFMDAVTFMNAMNAPPEEPAAAAPPLPPQKSGLSPSTTLVAGIATLVLAVGVGVLIGRSGEDNSAPVANQQPQIIRVGGSGPAEGAEEAAPGTNTGGKQANKANGGGKAAKKSKGKEANPEVEEGANGGSKAAQEVLHTAPGVKEAKPEAKVGESCEQGTAGCGKGGEFDGSFFE